MRFASALLVALALIAAGCDGLPHWNVRALLFRVMLLLISGLPPLLPMACSHRVL